MVGMVGLVCLGKLDGLDSSNTSVISFKDTLRFG